MEKKKISKKLAGITQLSPFHIYMWMSTVLQSL